MKRDTKSLKNRYEESYNSKDKGASGPGVVDFKKSGGEVKFFSMVKGYNKINIIPYVIKSKNHPLVKAGKAKIGELDYVLDLWAHRTASDGSFLCLKRTYNKSCPMCDHADEAKKDGRQDEYDELKSSRRVYYNVVDVANTSEGIQVMEGSHFYLEKEIIEASRETEDGDPIDFASPGLEGKIVKFKGTEASYAGNKYIKPKNFSFVDRTKPVLDKTIDLAISFDEFLVVPTKEEMERIIYGAAEPGEGDEDEDEDDDDDSSPDDDDDSDDDDEDSDDDDDDSEDEEESDDDDDSEDEEESDDDDDDEPPVKPNKPKKSGTRSPK